MPARKIEVEYYTTLDGDVFLRGDEVEFEGEEAERAEELGAFDPPATPPDPNEPPTEEELTAEPEGMPQPEEGAAPSSSEDVDSLKGAELDQAVRDAGIEGASTMTADEKRAALRDR